MVGIKNSLVFGGDTVQSSSEPLSLSPKSLTQRLLLMENSMEGMKGSLCELHQIIRTMVRQMEPLTLNQNNQEGCREGNHANPLYEGSTYGKRSPRTKIPSSRSWENSPC